VSFFLNFKKRDAGHIPAFLLKRMLVESLERRKIMASASPFENNPKNQAQCNNPQKNSYFSA